MSAPTFEDIFSDGMAQVRDALDRAPDAAREEVQQILDSDELVSRVVPIIEKRLRKQYRTIIIGMGVLLAIVVTAGAIAFNQIANVAMVNAATNTNQDAAIQRSQVSISAFEQQLDEANKKLVAQGLPPVQGPTDAQPGTPQQAQLSVAAATASTLASLPREVFVKPDATALAGAVADYVRANPIGVDPQLVINTVADYFTTNAAQFRGATGPQGPAGPAGPPVTAADIRQAFRDEVAANPNLLCSQGGTYSQRTLALANGGSTQNFGCFGNDTDPPGTGGGGGGGGTAADPGGTPGNTGGGGAATPPPATGGSTDPTPTTAPETPQETPSTAPVPEPAPSDSGILDDLLGVGTG